jgi:hypothetical protein
MLNQHYSQENLRTLLLTRDQWQPYPTLSDREAWSALPASVRAGLTGAGEALLGYEWPALPATLFLQFSRMGNRRNYEIPHFARRAALGSLVLAECVEGHGRFLDDIANGVWTICEESFWGVPAHIRVQRLGNTLPDTGEPIVDLFAAESAALLAWIDYLLGDRLDAVSPAIRPRLAREIDTRMLTPCLEREDFSWMGFVPRYPGHRVNNWNPWICSNWLACALLMETDETKRQASVYKAMRALDNFIDPYPKDGGCDEGPSYWGRAGASLFDCLELLYSASNGGIDVYGEPLIQEIGRFIHRVQIDGDYYINFADAPALVYPDAMLVYRYGLRIGDADMAAFGAWLAGRQEVADGGSEESAALAGLPKTSALRRRNVPTSLGRKLPALFTLATLPAGPSLAPPLPGLVWLPEIEVMVARDLDGSPEGLFLAAKGGHNDESHNHNDIGNFVVYVDGQPVIVDAGVETYTAKTFGPQRYEIWTMQSAYHSLLPTLDGVQQEPGAQFKASDVVQHDDGQQAQLSLDIAAAYPPAARLKQWRRTVTLHRKQAVEVVDQYELNQPANEITLSIVTPAAVRLEPGLIYFDKRAFLPDRVSGAGALHYPAEVFTLSSEEIPITDERLGGIWGESLTRVVLRAEQPPLQTTWRFRLVP